MPAGCRLEWLTDVRPEDSVAFLGQIAGKHADERHDKLLDESLVAVSMHAYAKGYRGPRFACCPAEQRSSSRKSRILAGRAARARWIRRAPATRYEGARPEASREARL